MDNINKALERLSNPVVKRYVEMLSDTESPPIFHVWALLSATAACLTRRSWFTAGAVTTMPNMYVMLVGPAGVRKSTAVRFAKKILDGIPVRFSPNSTGGRLQGLMTAMSGGVPKLTEEDKAIKDAMEASGGLNLGVDVEDLVDPFADLHMLQRTSMYVAEGELVSFIGMKMDEFITFLGDMWDKAGEDHFEYTLKKETVKLEKPCLNIIGGITPAHIINYLPAQAIGQGFTSRVIMVYADQAKRIAWPEEIPDESFNFFRKIMRHIFDTFDGAFNYTPGVRKVVEELYEYRVDIDDVRFIQYASRRQAHMFKVAMALAALRMDMTINEADIRDAHALLVATELRMAESLGEYGLDKSALAKVRISEALRNAPEPLSIHRLAMSCGSDVPRVEINRAVYQMVQDNIIIEVRLNDPNGVIKTGYVWPSSVNPFKRHEDVAITYFLEEGVPDIPARKSKLRAAVDALSAPQVEPDTSNIEEVVARELMTATSLAAQGFGTVADKLAAIINKRNGKETLQ